MTLPSQRDIVDCTAAVHWSIGATSCQQAPILTPCKPHGNYYAKPHANSNLKPTGTIPDKMHFRNTLGLHRLRYMLIRDVRMSM